MRQTFITLNIALVLSPSVLSQQLNGTALFGEVSGTSASCEQALQTNVTCHQLLPLLAQSATLWSEDHTNAICTEICHESLQSASKKIKAACTAAGDGIVLAGTQQAGRWTESRERSANVDSHPAATYLVDTMLHTLETSCRRDS